MKIHKDINSTYDSNLMDENVDEPLIQDVEEISDEHGDHVIVRFDDGSTAQHHTHGILSEEYMESTFKCIELTKKGLHWMKNNMWKNQKVDIQMMMQTSLMLADVSRMLRIDAQCISSDESERFTHD